MFCFMSLIGHNMYSQLSGSKDLLIWKSRVHALHSLASAQSWSNLAERGKEPNQAHPVAKLYSVNTENGITGGGLIRLLISL